jgi:hypothetical protein
MLKFKDGKSLEQAADEVLRSYLIRCYATVSKQYQPIAGMNPEEGVRHLLNLRNEEKIRITLGSVGELIECTISHVN